MGFFVVPPIAPGSAMGMDKSGTQTITANGSPQKVTGFAVRAGYPDTSIVSSELVMNGSITGTITYRGNLSSNFGTRTFYVFINDVQVASTGDETEAMHGPVNLESGDRIALYASATSISGDDVQPGSATTYIYIDPV